MATKSHDESKTLKVGDIAPDFNLKTAKRDEWQLADFRGKKNVVLAFVPYAFSSVCSTQLLKVFVKNSHQYKMCELDAMC